MSQHSSKPRAPSGQDLVPADVSLDNYRELWDKPDVPFARWFANSMLIAGVATVANTFLCALAAFSFSRLRFRARRHGGGPSGRHPGGRGLQFLQRFIVFGLTIGAVKE